MVRVKNEKQRLRYLYTHQLCYWRSKVQLCSQCLHVVAMQAQQLGKTCRHIVRVLIEAGKNMICCNGDFEVVE